MPSTAKVTDGRPRKSFYLGDPLAEPPPPELMSILDPFRGRRDALISVLQALQQRYGYLPERAMQYAARELGIPLARVYGVATFYNQFRFTAPGKIQLQVCCGTACHVGGAPALAAELKAHLHVGANETTPDGMFTLQEVFCVGCCSLAPVVIANGTAVARMKREDVGPLLQNLRTAEEGRT